MTQDPQQTYTIFGSEVSRKAVHIAMVVFFIFGFLGLLTAIPENPSSSQSQSTSQEAGRIAYAVLLTERIQTGELSQYNFGGYLPDTVTCGGVSCTTLVFTSTIEFTDKAFFEVWAPNMETMLQKDQMLEFGFQTVRLQDGKGHSKDIPL